MLTELLWLGVIWWWAKLYLRNYCGFSIQHQSEKFIEFSKLWGILLSNVTSEETLNQNNNEPANISKLKMLQCMWQTAKLKENIARAEPQIRSVGSENTYSYCMQNRMEVAVFNIHFIKNYSNQYLCYLWQHQLYLTMSN